jgi:hypothetical protein
VREGRQLRCPDESESEPAAHQPAKAKRPEDFQQVKYWYHDQYAEEVRRRNESGKYKGGQRGRMRARDGENVMFWFLEDESGNTLEAHDVQEIREAARTSWRLLWEESGGKLGCPWGKLHPSIQFKFYAEMEAKFPSLQLCHGHWKAKMVCTLAYSHWHNKQTRDALKREQGAQSDMEPVCPEKRPAETPLLTSPSKRSKGMCINSIHTTI